MEKIMTKVGAIIQARMGSTRLPGKVLKEVDGEALLGYMVNRVRQSKLVDSIIIATSTLERDEVIEDFCIKHSIDYFKGSESDVLQRYYDCASLYNLDVVVRLTADCPLVDPSIIDECVDHFLKNDEIDYFANAYPTSQSKYPDGSDVEVFSFDTLEKANEIEDSLTGREHVTPCICQNKDTFLTGILNNIEDWSEYRYTVDHPEDFEIVSFLIKKIKSDKIKGTTSEIVGILDRNPDVREKNKKFI
jgi:spore coat polysaccharide biosynthesis protein SpsF